MEPLKIEQLGKVKKFANDLGFNSYVNTSGEHAYFEIALPCANITVYYEAKGLTEHQATVGIGWTSCDGGQVSIAQTQDFIKFMGYAVKIAEKLRENSK